MGEHKLIQLTVFGAKKQNLSKLNDCYTAGITTTMHSEVSSVTGYRSPYLPDQKWQYQMLEGEKKDVMNKPVRLSLYIQRGYIQQSGY